MHSRLRPLCIAAFLLAILAMAPSGARGAQPPATAILVTDGGANGSAFTITGSSVTLSNLTVVGIPSGGAASVAVGQT